MTRPLAEGSRPEAGMGLDLLDDVHDDPGRVPEHETPLAPRFVSERVDDRFARLGEARIWASVNRG